MESLLRIGRGGRDLRGRPDCDDGPALRKRFGAGDPCRFVIEVGTQSPWVQRLLKKLGHEVITAHTRSVRLTYGGTSENDRLDAERLVRLARVDPKLLHPIRHRECQGHPRRASPATRIPSRITKAGDHDLRRLLIGSAHYILGPFGPDTDLRRWGLALAARGKRNAKKRAVVAVARKLAVLLHRHLEPPSPDDCE